MRKIAVFTGTRAEYGLLYWLLRDIQADELLSLKLLVSGMHLSPEFGETYSEIENDGFIIDQKVEILLSSDTSLGVAKSLGLGVLGFSDALSNLAPDVLVILGDRFEALAAAQAAMILGIPILHLHGGEITEGAYDDSIRHAITKFSTLHATSTEEHRRRVIQLGEQPESVFNVGAMGLDHLKRSKLLTKSELSQSLGFSLNKPYFLVTYHPVTLAGEEPTSSCKEMLRVLDFYPNHQIIFTYPNADNGGRGIISLLENYADSQPDRVLCMKSLGQLRYLSAVKFSDAVIGNSSSGIIEVPSFGVPTVNIGMRQKGRCAAESVMHCDPITSQIKLAIDNALQRTFKGNQGMVTNPYGDGGASKRIINLLKTLKLPSVKVFFDLEVDN
ncbi:UDP-N-acetylglucosamine 2-epimerase [Gammaproteobacteria bacterium]|nr:UDP-N-acetylglucosamine 2-epimerase [Gammaproteobacteria bacterium]